MTRKFRGATLVCIAALATTGCGGSDSGGSSPPAAAMTPAPVPSPAPSPTPTPTPTPSALTLATLGLTAGNTGNSLDPQEAAAYQTTVADPDAPAATRFEEINFDGDETITIRHSATTAPAYDEAFPANTLTDSNDSYFYFGSANERRLPFSAYQNRRNGSTSAAIFLPRLEEVRKTGSSAATTGDVPEHVRLLDVRPGNLRAYQLIGSPTRPTELPTSGIRTMAGESNGLRSFSNGGLQEFLGDSVLTVDFERKTVTGQISIAQFLGSTPVRPTLTVEIVAQIAVDGSLTGKVTVRGDRVFETGFLTGSLYGASADEIGMLITTSGESGSIVGGLVAGQE